MLYFTDGSKMTGGCEWELAHKPNSECSGWGVYQWEQAIRNAGFSWIRVESDGSYNVKVELVSPTFLLPLDGQAYADIKALLEFVESKGGKILKGCGLHANIGTRLVAGVPSDEFWNASKLAMSNENRFYRPSAVNLSDAMPIELVKDVIKRYAIHHDDVDSLLSPSRRCESSGIFSHPAPADHWPQDNNNQSYFCHSIRRIAGVMESRFDACTTEYEVAETLKACQTIYRSQHAKFAAINMGHFGTGRIEFRQHQGTLNVKKTAAWLKLIEQMFRYSHGARVAHVPEQQVNNGTPASPYRNGSRLAVMWETIRRDGGATTQQISNATGWDAGTIRARISEMRARHGQDNIRCHTQQRYGNAYGSSQGNHDLNGYEAIQGEVVTVPAHWSLLPANRIGMTSIFAGLDDQTFAYLMERRADHMRD